jgi:hypothetical protein
LLLLRDQLEKTLFAAIKGEFKFSWILVEWRKYLK